MLRVKCIVTTLSDIMLLLLHAARPIGLHVFDWMAAIRTRRRPDLEHHFLVGLGEHADCALSS